MSCPGCHAHVHEYGKVTVPPCLGGACHKTILGRVSLDTLQAAYQFGRYQTGKPVDLTNWPNAAMMHFSDWLDLVKQRWQVYEEVI